MIYGGRAPISRQVRSTKEDILRAHTAGLGLLSLRRRIRRLLGWAFKLPDWLQILAMFVRVGHLLFFCPSYCSGSRGLLVDLVGRGHEERLTWSAPPLSVCLSTAFFVAALPRQVRRCIALRCTALYCNCSALLSDRGQRDGKY